MATKTRGVSATVPRTGPVKSTNKGNKKYKGKRILKNGGKLK